MRNRDGTRWMAAPSVALLALLSQGCGSREAATPENAGPGTSEATAALPAEPPPGGEEMPLEEQPEVDTDSGLEVRFGTQLAGAGEIAEPVISFGHGDRVCLGATLPGAAPGDELLIRWYDAAGEERGSGNLALAGDPPKGALCLPGSEQLTLGSYSLELELAGRAVGDAAFTVADSREVPRRGGA